ncbi:MAG: class C sortase [Actinomycetaceae bacterium]|nr:class C sortase [Arcanobacterium sp.]MDD7505686.1 class C sortase [Actinomycetaceae bacterium]MDY6143174.1 class C sortase [Arcanobacterium sp.]
MSEVNSHISAPRGQGASQASNRPGRALPLLTVILAMLGTTVFLYPQAAQWFNQVRQAKIVDAYAHVLQHTDPPASEQITQARRYNSLLETGSIVDIAGHVPTVREAAILPEDAGVKPYTEQLQADTTGLMGRITMPVADIDLPIYHGTSDATLLRGAGHLQGTALPVGGSGTRTVITAHRGLATATMFTHLDRVENGAEFTLEIFGEALVYRVFDVRVVDPDDTEAVRAIEGKDLATLITCTPLGVNTQRIVVTGERVLPTPQDALDSLGEASELPRFPWWIVIWLAMFAASLAFYFYVRSKQRSR